MALLDGEKGEAFLNGKGKERMGKGIFSRHEHAITLLISEGRGKHATKDTKL